MVWLTIFTDLSPLYHVWDILRRTIATSKPFLETRPENYVAERDGTIAPKTPQLTSRMKSQCEACISIRGTTPLIKPFLINSVANISTLSDSDECYA